MFVGYGAIREIRLENYTYSVLFLLDLFSELSHVVEVMFRNALFVILDSPRTPGFCIPIIP